jgi:hypothetical protein
MLSAFTPGPQETKVTGKDSSVVNVTFSPAQLIVQDNRQPVDGTAIIQGNTESNLKVASAIEKVAEVLNTEMRERRCVSLMDRITQQTGLSVNEVEKIIHKKRVYDATMYTIFVIVLLFLGYGINQHTIHSKLISSNEFWVRTISYVLLFVTVWLIFKYGSLIINKDYTVIQAIINSPPG